MEPISVLLLASGLLIGFGIRIVYHRFTGKDFPLLKHPYVTHPSGNITEYEIDRPCGN